MRSIAFVRSPAFATLGESVSLAARYWRSTWDRWLLAVLAVALVTGLAEWLLGGSVVDQRTMSRAFLPGSQGQIDPAELPRLMAGPLAVGAVSVVAGWFLLANAVAGLRGREITLSWVVASGLRTFAAAMLVALVFVVLLTISVGLGPIGLVVMLVALPVLVYAALRLVFWNLAVFDGSSIGQGARASWAITRRAVLRVLAWELAIFAIGLAVAVIDIVADIALAGAPVAASVIASAIDTTLQAFTIVLIAILYESQRLRTQPPAVIARPLAPYDPEGPYPPPPPPQA